MVPSGAGPSLDKANDQMRKALLEVNNKHYYMCWHQGSELDLGDTQPHVPYQAG